MLSDVRNRVFFCSGEKPLSKKEVTVTVHMLNIKTPSAGVFCLSGKDMTFAGSFDLPVTLIFLLLSKCLVVAVVRMDYMDYNVHEWLNFT